MSNPSRQHGTIRVVRYQAPSGRVWRRGYLPARRVRLAPAASSSDCDAEAAAAATACLRLRLMTGDGSGAAAADVFAALRPLRGVGAAGLGADAIASSRRDVWCDMRIKPHNTHRHSPRDNIMASDGDTKP